MRQTRMQVVHTAFPHSYAGGLPMRRANSTMPIILFGLLCSIVLLPHVTHAQQDVPRVVIIEADPHRTIARTIQQPDFAFGLTLENRHLQEEVRDLVIALGPLTRGDGVVEADRMLRSAVDQSPSTQVILPPGSRRIVTISGYLPQPMQYTSWLALTHGGRTDVYALVLTRTASPPLRILEAGDDGRLTFQSSTPQTAHAITVQLPAGQPTIDQLRIALGELSRQDGQPIQDARLTCSLCGGEPLALQTGQAITLLLQGERLQVGTYVTSIRFGYGGVTQVVPVRLTRAEPTQNLQVIPPGTVALMRSIWGQSAAVVPIVVREVHGHARSIYYPILNRFEMTNTEGQRFSVVVADVLALHDPSGKVIPISPQPSSATVTLPFNQNMRFIYQLHGLEHGAYTGQVAVSGPESANVTADFTITVKDHWFWALLMLLLGVLVAYALTEWIDAGRARALRGVLITEEIESLEQLMREAEVEDTVWTRLCDQLKQLHRKNRWKIFGANEIEAELTELRSRKQTYRQALTAHAQIAEFIASYLTTGQEALHQRVQEALNKVQEAVRAGVPPAERDGALQALQTLRQDVQREAIRRPAERLLLQVRALADESPELPAEAQALSTNIQQHVIDQAHAGQIDDLLARLRQYRRDYARLRFTQLTGLLDQLDQERRKVSQPTAADWQVVDELVSQAQDKLRRGRSLLASDQLDEALVHWDEAHAHYLGALVHQLSILIGDTGRPSDIPPDDWQAILEQVPNLRRQLDEAFAHWRAGDIAQTQHSYEHAREEYVTVLTAVLAYRLDTALALSECQPPQPDLTEWRVLTDQFVTPAVDRLHQVKRELPQRDSTALKRWDQYRAIHVKALAVQVELIQALYQRLVQYDQKRRATVRIDSTWPGDLSKELQTLRTALEKAQDTLPGDVTHAEQILYEAQHVYSDLLERLRPPSGEIAASARTSPPAPLVKPTVALVPPHSPAPVPEAGTWRLAPQRLAGVLIGDDERSSAEQLRGIAARNLMYLGLVMLIAAMTGLQALWMNKATFGGADYITTFLWGFGTLGTAAGFSAAARRYQLPGTDNVQK